MKRKYLSTITILIILSLLTTGLAFAKDLGEWVVSFTPSEYGYNDVYSIFAVETFKSDLYVGVSGYEFARVYRSPDGITWEASFAADFPYFVTFDMQSYDGGLYVALNDVGLFGGAGAVFRTLDGMEWNAVFEPGADLNGGIADKFGVFDTQIYLTSVAIIPDASSQVWRSPSGDPGTWEKVAELGADVESTSSPTVFKDYLYISGYSADRGILLWRSADGAAWETLDVAAQFSPSDSMDGNLVAFKGSLYLSTANETGGRIYRSKNGLDWQPVVTDGLDDPANFNFSALTTYQSHLIATVNNSVCWCARLLTSETGDPGGWEIVDLVGWPVESGTVRNALAIFKDDLYIANSDFMGSVYRMLHP